MGLPGVFELWGADTEVWSGWWSRVAAHSETSHELLQKLGHCTAVITFEDDPAMRGYACLVFRICAGSERKYRICRRMVIEHWPKANEKSCIAACLGYQIALAEGVWYNFWCNEGPTGQNAHQYCDWSSNSSVSREKII